MATLRGEAVVRWADFTRALGSRATTQERRRLA